MNLSWYTVFNWLTRVKKINPEILSTDIQILIDTYPDEINEIKNYLLEKEKRIA